MLFKLVFILHCYHESHRGELFLKHSVFNNFRSFYDDTVDDRYFSILIEDNRPESSELYEREERLRLCCNFFT